MGLCVGALAAPTHRATRAPSGEEPRVLPYGGANPRRGVKPTQGHRKLPGGGADSGACDSGRNRIGGQGRKAPSPARGHALVLALTPYAIMLLGAPGSRQRGDGRRAASPYGCPFHGATIWAYADKGAANALAAPRRIPQMPGETLRVAGANRAVVWGGG